MILRFILISFIFFSTSLALDITKDKVPVHRTIETLTSSTYTINDIIEKPEEFKKVKFFRRHLMKRYDNNNLWLKLSINHKETRDINRIFITKWQRVKIDLYLVKDNKIIQSEQLQKDNIFLRSTVLNFLPNENYELYLNIKTGKAHDELHYMYFMSPEEKINFIVNKIRLYDHGLFFGIILSMMCYSFFMFFSINEKAYLYLGLHQLVILVYSSKIRDYMFILLENYPNFSYFLLKILWYFLIIFFATLFTKEFINKKEKNKLLNHFLNFALLMLFLTNMNDDPIEFGTIFLFIFIFIGIYEYLKGNLSALFYVFGFLFYASFMFFNNISKMLDLDFYFEFHSLIQISACLTSFSLTMALYLKIKEIMISKKETEDMLRMQSKFATMGEMLASVAHQWKQPINHLSLIFASLQIAKKKDKFTEVFLDKKTQEANLQLKYMADTITDFSNYFSEKGKIEQFSLEEVCRLTLALTISRCKKNNINVIIYNKSDKIYSNYKNELMQVLVIVLNNAIEALISSNNIEKNIKIIINNNHIDIENNGGQIPKKILHKIFNPYFSTKDKKFGTGLGLYTAKMLSENILNAKINAYNIPNGVVFSILLTETEL